MKKIQKKLSVVLAVMMVLCMFTALPFSASAAETSEETSAGNKINVTSNVADPVSYDYNAQTEQVVVTYLLKADHMIVNAQSSLTYDSKVLKLASTKTGDTLCSPLRKVVLDGIHYPSSSYTMAVYPAKKGDEDKVAQGIAKLADEDPTIKLVSNHETHEMLISGLGEQHLDVVISRLKTKYNVDAVLKNPKIAYRETIRKKVSAQGRYKKQSGGHGQFGDVWIEFEPCDSDGLVFAERVVGGAVPKNFFPAVEKGLQDSIKKGVLAGYPMVGIKATLYDGSYHPVDSSEMSFKTAASLAYKNGIPNASPTLLEPIGSLKANVPDANMGDVMGEVNKRRGRVLGMQPGENGTQIVEAEVPMAEMDDFATYIRQVTQGRGSFEFAFVRYEDTPANVAQKIIEKAKADSPE